MKTFVTFVFASVIALSALAEHVDWEHNYDHALEQAKKDKKLVMVDVYTDWCGWCKKLDQTVFKDKAVEEKLGKGFVAVKINPEVNSKNAKLAKEFGTRSYPHIVFTDADGKKVGEIRGYVAADAFLKQLEQLTAKSAK